jgi:hypothetical protein
MYTYALLDRGHYYIIQPEETTELELVRVLVSTDHCALVARYGELETLHWVRKSDPIHDIIELLDDKAVQQWHDAYYPEDAFDYEEGDE